MFLKNFANTSLSVSLLTVALCLSGCTAILNETNDKPIEEDPGRRSLGSIIDDQSIETTATVNIRKTDTRLDQANVVVTSYNGIVLLTGQVPSEDLRTGAAQTTALVKNVRQVHNHLSVGENAGFAVHSADALITTKVKTKLLGTANIKDSRVKVVTENGAVFLLGLVTRAEGDIASSVARNTDGVQKVVLLFEYVDN